MTNELITAGALRKLETQLKAMMPNENIETISPWAVKELTAALQHEKDELVNTLVKLETALGVPMSSSKIEMSRGFDIEELRTQVRLSKDEINELYCSNSKTNNYK